MVKPNSLSRKSKNLRRPAGAGKAEPAQARRPAAQPPGDGQGGDTERRILEAARREFIAKGLDGARMQAIAAGAGVNKALLHYYHRSKDRLYRTVVRDILDKVWGNIRAEMRALGPGEGLEAMVRALVSTYVRTLAANPEFPAFMLRELTSGGAAFREVLADADITIGDIPKRLMAAVQAGVAAGVVKPTHPLHFFLNLMGMCVAPFLVRPALERLGPAAGFEVRYDEDFFAERIRSIVDLAMRGVAARREA